MKIDLLMRYQFLIFLQNSRLADGKLKVQDKLKRNQSDLLSNYFIDLCSILTSMSCPRMQLFKFEGFKDDINKQIILK